MPSLPGRRSPLETVVGVGLGLVGLGLWVWGLIDVIQVPTDTHFRAGSRLLWTIVLMLTGFLGALVYLAVGRPWDRPWGRPDRNTGRSGTRRDHRR